MRYGWLVFGFLILPSCVTPSFIANNMTGTLEDMKSSFFSEPNPQHAFAAGPGLLKQLDGFIVSSPDNEELLRKGAEMNCGFALTFLDDYDRRWAADLYEKGRQYGLAALKIEYPEVEGALRRGDESALASALREVDRDDTPLIFWTGLCWGGRLNATMDVEGVIDLPLVEALISRSLELEEEYYFGAGHLFFGMLNAGRSEMLGGDLEKGRVHFEKAIELMDGRFLLAKVLYAMTYAVQKQDHDLFAELLDDVAEDTTEDEAAMRLANNVARQKASVLLDKVEDFFPGYEEFPAQDEPEDDEFESPALPEDMDFD